MTTLPRLNISASAGSGKTFALSTHYIAMLVHGAPAESVFASTFTRKAASEILDRVLLRIATAARSEAEAADLAAHITKMTGHAVTLTPASCAELLAKLMRQLHRLGISTLDAFFVRTATCFSLELNLPPGWRIASEVQQRQLAADAVDELLREAEADDPQALVELVRQVNRGTADRSVHETLLNLFRSLHPIYQETATPPDTAAATDDPPPASPWHTPVAMPAVRLDDEALSNAIQALASAELPLTKAGNTDGRFAKAVAPIVDCALRRDWPKLLEQKLITQLIAKDLSYYKVPFTDELTAALQPLLDHARTAALEQLIGQRAALHRLIADYDRHYRALQVRRRAFRFDDVTRSLGDTTLLPEHLEIFYRLDARIHHLLLDEFQDTSLAQWRALEPIASEILSYGDGSRAALIVADPKQSIYGWRGGEPELVHHIGDQFGLEKATLRRSFRSSPVVLETVNRICEHLPRAAVLGNHQQVVTDWMRAYTPHQAAFDIPGHARVHVAPAAENTRSRTAQEQQTFRRAAEIIKQLVTDAPGRTIGVLVRTNKAVRRMIHELRQPDIAVDASEEGGNPLTDSPAVCAVLALLRLADHPSDTIARFHVAATPLGRVVNLTDHADSHTAHRIANDLRHRLLVDGYGPTLHDLTQHLAPHCDQRDLARLLQLVELGCAHEADANIRTRDFITLVETTRVEDVTAADVRVMTVHQSKGLEFDIVVLPQLDVPPISTRPPTLYVHRENPTSPIETVFPAPTTAVRNALPGTFDRLHESHQYQQMRDALSMLYVALTRARNALHMVVAPTAHKKTDKPASTFATLIREALADDAPAEPGDDDYYTAGDENWHQHVEQPDAAAAPVAKQGREPETSDQPAPLLAESTRRDRALPRRSPSSMHDDRTVDLNNVLRLDSGHALNLGSAFHALCEHVTWHGDPLDREALRQTLGPFNLDRVDAVLDDFERMIAQPDIAAALSREAYAADGEVEVKREHPFALRLDDALVTGFFDRLVLSRDAAGRVAAAHILDYKTDRVDATDAAALDELIERYRAQLDTYRRAAAKLYSLRSKNVTAKLILLRAGKVVEI